MTAHQTMCDLFSRAETVVWRNDYQCGKIDRVTNVQSNKIQRGMNV